MIQPAYNPPDERSKSLLAEVLVLTCRSLKGVNTAQYRLEHEADLDCLDKLINVKHPLLERAEPKETIRVSLLGLHFIDNKIQHALVDDIDHVLNFLRERYREKKTEAVVLSDIAQALKISRPRVELCIHYAKTPALMQSTLDLTDAGASVIPSEQLLRFRNLSDWLSERVKQLNAVLLETAKPIQKIPHGNVEKSAKRREVILAAALWVIHNRHAKCLQGEQLSGTRIVDQIELVSEGWWPDKAQMPARRTMVNLINKCLKKQPL